MILANHVGEEAVIAAAITGAGAISSGMIILRAKLASVGGRLRRKRLG